MSFKPGHFEEKNPLIFIPNINTPQSRLCYYAQAIREQTKTEVQCLQILSSEPKPWIRKVRTSSRHLLADIRAIHGTWYTSIFFRNKTFLFVKIESWNFQHLFYLLKLESNCFISWMEICMIKIWMKIENKIEIFLCLTENK